MIEIWSRSEMKKLSQIRRKWFDVTKLSFFIQGVECKRRFPWSRHSSDRCYFILRDRYINILQIMCPDTVKMDEIGVSCFWLSAWLSFRSYLSLRRRRSICSILFCIIYTSRRFTPRSDRSLIFGFLDCHRKVYDKLNHSSHKRKRPPIWYRVVYNSVLYVSALKNKGKNMSITIRGL